ncbi:MAG: MBL fold metallo-hydrolase [Rubricoccaceae bacterium]
MTVHLLGTGSAEADGSRTTTMLALEHDGQFILVDCGGDAVQRLLAAGLDAAAVSAVILTHEHPDHVGGFPLLVEKLWLLGRRAPIPVYGPERALSCARRLLDVFDLEGWTDVPERTWHPVPLEPKAPVLRDDTFAVAAWPVVHPVPTIGLRVEAAGGAAVAYSSDTARAPVVTELAREADLLVHEATGSKPGVHASAEEAARTAAEAGAGQLVLVHLPAHPGDEALAEARQWFSRTSYGTDGETIPLAR